MIHVQMKHSVVAALFGFACWQYVIAKYDEKNENKKLHFFNCGNFGSSIDNVKFIGDIL